MNTPSEKDLIWQRAMEKRHADRLKELWENKRTLLVDRLVYYKSDFCPHLTHGRVRKAAKVLDKVNPEWMDEQNSEDLLLQKVARTWGLICQNNQIEIVCLLVAKSFPRFILERSLTPRLPRISEFRWKICFCCRVNERDIQKPADRIAGRFLVEVKINSRRNKNFPCGSHSRAKFSRPLRRFAV